MFVRRKTEAQREAKRLRSELGWSLARIARELGVAKSSVSVWVRGLEPPGTPSPPPRPVDAMPTVRLRVWRSGSVRRCGRCGNALPTESFNRLGGGLQWWCRRCFAGYFRERGDTHRRQSKAAKSARQRALRAQLLAHLRRHPCVDCGETDPVVLEFDHVGEKTASISVLLSQTATRKAIDAEIARCEVVCTNCHRRRTAYRAGWRRASHGAAGAPLPHSTCRTEPRPRLRRPPSGAVHGLRRARPARARVRSRRPQARRRHAPRLVRLQSRDDRCRDREMPDPLRQLPSPHDGQARRPFPLSGPKLLRAPVAQLV